MNSYINWSIVFILCLQTQLYAQQNLRGLVIDSQSHYPIPGVNILIQGSSLGTTTDHEGKFLLVTNEDVITLSISAVGYETLQVTTNSLKELTIRLKSDLRQLDEVVVSAFERKRKLIETPATISRINAEDFERFDLRSPQQALSTMPGVKVESTTIGRYRVSIRGGNLSGAGHSENYKMYWNSIPMTLADGTPPLAFVDMGSIGTLDIIRGPSGSIYGAGLTGVALVENKTPVYKQTKLDIDGFTGSYGTYRYSASLSSGGEKGDIRVQYSDVHTDGYREESSSSNQFLNFFGRVFPSEKQTISFLGIFGKRDYGIPGTLTAEQVAEDPRQTTFSPELDNGLKGNNLLIGIGNDYRWNNHWTNNTSLNYQVLESSFLIGNAFFVSADQSLNTSFALRNATTYAFNAFSKPARFVFGIEYTRGIGGVDVFSNGFGSEISSRRETTNELMLGFAQAEFELPGAVQLILGGSYNNYRLDFKELLDLTGENEFERNVQDFSPKIALVKPLKDNFVVHANISKGFVPPPRSAFDNSNETVNANLKSTIGWNKEVGIRGTSLNDKLSLDLTFYRLDENDVIVPRVVETINTIDFIQNENAGAINRQGVELALQYQLLRNASGFLSVARWFGNYTYMHHEFEEYNTLDTENDVVSFNGNQLPGISPNTVVTGIDLKSSTGLYFFGTYSFYDEIYLDNANSVRDDSYQLLDLKIGFKRMLGEDFGINLYGGINNAFNAEYSQMYTFNSGIGAYFDPAMDRNYYGGLSLKYIFN